MFSDIPGQLRMGHVVHRARPGTFPSTPRGRAARGSAWVLSLGSMADPNPSTCAVLTGCASGPGVRNATVCRVGRAFRGSALCSQGTSAHAGHMLSTSRASPEQAWPARAHITCGGLRAWRALVKAWELLSAGRDSSPLCRTRGQHCPKRASLALRQPCGRGAQQEATSHPGLLVWPQNICICQGKEGRPAVGGAW